MNKSRGDLDSLKIALIFSVCDGPLGDEKHFDRFYAELERLRIPFAVNFDHCSKKTKDMFSSHPYFFAGNYNDWNTDNFHEAHRQYALDLVLKRGGFDWILQMDVDETFEHDAPAKIRKVMELNADVVDCRVLDLWGDERHYRVDGPFQSSHREKFFNLRTAKQLYYYHPTSHAPKHVPNGDREPIVVRMYPLHVLHWGIMNQEDAEFHCQRWDRIYTRAVGGNPYGLYPYLRDPVTYPPKVWRVPEGTHGRHT